VPWNARHVKILDVTPHKKRGYKYIPVRANERGLYVKVEHRFSETLQEERFVYVPHLFMRWDEYSQRLKAQTELRQQNDQAIANIHAYKQSVLQPKLEQIASIVNFIHGERVISSYPLKGLLAKEYEPAIDLILDVLIHAESDKREFENTLKQRTLEHK
jgi:hypothetical protein